MIGKCRLLTAFSGFSLVFGSTKRRAYWLDCLSQQGHSSPIMCKSLSTLLDRDRNVSGATGHTADGFAAFFAGKIDDVMAATAAQPPPSVVDTAHCSLPSFHSCSQAEVRRIIMSSPAKSCPRDPIPTCLCREFVDLLLPYITSMINASLRQGRLQDSQKHAVVVPLLKSPD